jgi:hypothetical protein
MSQQFHGTSATVWEGSLRHNSIFNSGEALLHVCAKLGAANCIKWLAQIMGSTLERKDQCGVTPLQVATWSRQKVAVVALIIHVAHTSCSESLQCERARKARWRTCPQCAVIGASCKDLAARLAVSVVPTLGESLSADTLCC